MNAPLERFGFGHGLLGLSLLAGVDGVAGDGTHFCIPGPGAHQLTLGRESARLEEQGLVVVALLTGHQAAGEQSTDVALAAARRCRGRRR